jgi:hypothetical protein
VPYKYKKWKAKDEKQKSTPQVAALNDRIATEEVETKRDSILRVGAALSTSDLFETIQRPIDFQYEDLALIDEDTRHSAESFQSVSDATPPPMPLQPIHQLRSHVNTPNSEILCKTEDLTHELHSHSQSLPAASEFLNWSSLPLQVYIYNELIIILMISSKIN